MPDPYESLNRSALVEALKREKSILSNNFRHRFDDLKSLIRESIGGNTFRAFQKMPEKPSVFFREWAFDRLSTDKTIFSLQNVFSQDEYDEWIKDFAKDLYDSWKGRMGDDKAISYGPRMKLCNLLLKRVILWNKIEERNKNLLITFLHVPLDQYTLVAIRNCIDSDSERDIIGKIPKRPTMNLVRNEPMYFEIQNVIRSIANDAGVPPIFLDALAWDKQHQNKTP
ncbi:hypothetical protein ACFL7M_09815 [Thermodesulfobacteriota bacterium]